MSRPSASPESWDLPIWGLSGFSSATHSKQVLPLDVPISVGYPPFLCDTLNQIRGVKAPVAAPSPRSLMRTASRFCWSFGFWVKIGNPSGWCSIIVDIRSLIMVRSWILTTKNWEIAWILTDPLDILKGGDWAGVKIWRRIWAFRWKLPSLLKSSTCIPQIHPNSKFHLSYKLMN